jgi:carnitine-CoA ligase
MEASELLSGLSWEQPAPVALFRALAETDEVAAVDAEDGRRYSYAEIACRADVISSALRDGGVVAGDHVVWTAPTSIDSIAIWMGIAALGAVDVCVGDALKGSLLNHVMTDCAPAAAVLRSDATGGVALLDEQHLASLRAAVAIRPPVERTDGTGVLPGFAELNTDQRAPSVALDEHVAPANLAAVIYTSGTTGPSKGVMLCHHHQLFVGANLAQQWQVDRGATLYHYSPFNHVTGRQLVVTAMLVGGTLVMRDRFSPGRFWADINEHGITHAIVLGSGVPLLLDQSGDHAHNDGSLRHVWASPAMPRPYRDFAERFGVRVFSPYGSTEVGIVVEPSIIPDDEGPAGNCGHQGEYFELTVLDEHDRQVPAGAVGEIAVRPRVPYSTFLGYLNRDDATRETNRNLWYHSGDLGRMDENGFLFFTDRKQDFLRSKGENISSLEIEQILVRHRGVADLCIIPVPSELADDDVCAVVECSANAPFDPLDFYYWSAEQVPYFMVPRYVRIAPALPRGPSGKVEKYKLRQAGVDADTWDAAKLGLRAGRAGIVGGSPPEPLSEVSP